MTRPLQDGGPIIRRPSSHIQTEATMDRHYSRRRFRQPEPLLCSRGTCVLLDPGAIRLRGSGNLQAVATMARLELEDIGPHRQELELLVRASGTTTLHHDRIRALRTPLDGKTLPTVPSRQGRGLAGWRRRGRGGRWWGRRRGSSPCRPSPLLILPTMTRPLQDGGPIIRRPSSHIQTEATMDRHYSRRRFRQPEPLLCSRGTCVLLDPGAIRLRGSGNLQAVATMARLELEDIGPHRQELELLVRASGTTTLHHDRIRALRTPLDGKTLPTVPSRQGRGLAGWRRRGRGSRYNSNICRIFIVGLIDIVIGRNHDCAGEPSNSLTFQEQ